MKIVEVKTLFIALLLSTAVPSLPAEDAAYIVDKAVSEAAQIQDDFSKAVERLHSIEIERALIAGASVDDLREATLRRIDRRQDEFI